MSTAVFGFTDSIPEAEKLVSELRDQGFPPESVSLLFPRDAHAEGVVFEKNSKASEGMAAGAGTGVLIGGALGWLTGIGALAIPGVGPFIAAGPIMAALGGAAVGATVGGVAGGLIGLGIPEYEAKHLERRINEGEILVAVRAMTQKQRERAMEILRDGGASDVACAAEGRVVEGPQPHV